MEHYDHTEHGNDREKDVKFRELLAASNAFRCDPERWWTLNRDRLRLPMQTRFIAQCIDERVDLANIPDFRMRNTVDGASLPGSGITLSKAAYTHVIQQFRTCAHGTCNHTGCTACEQFGGDVEGANFARRMAQELTVPYLGQIDKLEVANDYHPAEGAWLRYTPTHRNPSRKTEGAPLSFDTSLWLLSGEKWREERVKLIQLPIHIAFGGHGMGNRFRANNVPLLLPFAFSRFDRLYSKNSIEEEIYEAARREGQEELVRPIALAVD